MHITASRLSKYYQARITPGSRLVQLLSGRKQTGEQVAAVHEINLEIPAGQCVGLIGRNGSGKSTLLRLMAGILEPTSGRLEVNGRLSTVLDLQSGLNPRMTGRQNIYLKGALYGLDRRAIEQRLDAIVAFSGLEEYIEYPITSYSTGMVIRLGFAIAMHLDFEILLMDEILAVGDLVFQRQCLAKIKGFLAEGKTVVLASHNLGDVAAICERVVFLRKGVVLHDGLTETVLKEYCAICDKEQNRIPRELQPLQPENVYGTDTREVQLVAVRITDGDNREVDTVQTGDRVQLHIGYRCRQPVHDPLFRVQIFRNDGLWVHGTNTARHEIDLGELRGEGEVVLQYDQLNLLAGDYYLTVGIWPDEFRSSFVDIAYDCHQWGYILRVQSSRRDGAGIVHNPCSWKRVETVPPPGTSITEADVAEKTVT